MTDFHLVYILDWSPTIPGKAFAIIFQFNSIFIAHVRIWLRRDQMLFDDAGLEDCERMFEQDPEASGGLGALRASGEGVLLQFKHVQ